VTPRRGVERPWLGNEEESLVEVRPNEGASAEFRIEREENIAYFLEKGGERAASPR